ncbi:MAG: hypothetical protein AAGI44_16095, partial [Pseudomonadota bacterium]
MKRFLCTWMVAFLWLSGCSSKDNPGEVELETTQATEVILEAPIELSQEDIQADVISRAQAPLLAGLGDFSFPISTNDPWVQRYFDQGMVMAAGFNHAEAVRAFQAGQRLDPGCGMCFWGEALALGPNINVTSKGKAIMLPDDRVAAHSAIQKALSLQEGMTERERDLVAA